MGEFNTRDTLWDTNGNKKGKDIKNRIARTQFRIIALQSPTFHAKGRRVSSTPDLVITNTQGSNVTVKNDGVWKGSSEHTPIQVQTQTGGREGNGRGRSGLWLQPRPT